MKRKEELVLTNFKLPQHMRTQLRIAALRSNRSMAEILRELITNWLRDVKHKKENEAS